MKNRQVQCSDGVPEFTGEDFFRPGESVYIHMSTEFPDFVGVVHKHKFIEIVYIISGQAVHVVGDHRSGASKGDLFIINYETPHAFYGDKDFKEEFISYDLMFTPDFFNLSMIDGANFESLGSSYLFNSLFPENQRFGPDLQLTGSSYNVFGDIFKKIYLEYKGREKGYIDIIRAYVIELIIKMFRKMDTSAQQSISYRQARVVDSALSYLRENFNTHVTMKDLANRTFLSKDYFGRMFRETTGLPVSALLQQIRIEQACKLLCSTDRKITQVAEDCGFGDMKSFYNCFKKTMGVTPGEYRNAAVQADQAKT
ncbi:MAG: HTH-type transcriptional activator RhaR [Syntrophaceae bacterium PtaU1.Bin231]|nr:MAG: HTH-type transcriptional activator RhaR [Syntrophaceae bacterium PtaU1.Bin231]